MPHIAVTSVNHPRLADYQELTGNSYRRHAATFVVEGQTLVRRALESQLQVESLLICDRLAGRVPWVPAPIPTYVADEAAIRQIVGYNFHRGMLACVRRPQPTPLNQLISSRPRQTLVVCPEICDATNLGSILRCCAAFAVDGVLLGSQGADPFSRRVVRVSMGASLHLLPHVTAELGNELTWLTEEAGFCCLATMLDEEAESLERLQQRPPRLAVLLGSEFEGLSDRWLQYCHRRASIAMPPTCDSLNVAVAAGIFLYHLTRLA